MPSECEFVTTRCGILLLLNSASSTELTGRHAMYPMDEINPVTWSSPDWHPDWDGEWQVEQLRQLAIQFLESSLVGDRAVRLEIIEEGYVRVAFYASDRCLGVCSVNRSHDQSPIFAAYFGAEDDEINTESSDEVIRFLSEARGHWEHEPPI